MFRLILIAILTQYAIVAVGGGGEQTTEIVVKTASPANRNLKFTLRVPSGFNRSMAENARIMVLFGGRNWPGERAIRVFGFGELADDYHLFLLSPWFRDDDYWQPEPWSGRALLEAVEQVRQRFNLPERRMLYYGYSAGGQCATLFYHWRPELVEAWSVHACGVWQQPDASMSPSTDRARLSDTGKNNCKKHETAFALITCGEDDQPRFISSQHYVRNARENGAQIIFRGYAGGHALQRDALKLARAFFASVLDGGAIRYIGDDQTRKYYPAGSKEAKRIEIEYRNPFLNLDTAILATEGN